MQFLVAQHTGRPEDPAVEVAAISAKPAGAEKFGTALPPFDHGAVSYGCSPAFSPVCRWWRSKDDLADICRGCRCPLPACSSCLKRTFSPGNDLPVGMAMSLPMIIRESCHHTPENCGCGASPDCSLQRSEPSWRLEPA